MFEFFSKLSGAITMFYFTFPVIVFLLFVVYHYTSLLFGGKGIISEQDKEEEELQARIRRISLEAEAKREQK